MLFNTWTPRKLSIAWRLVNALFEREVFVSNQYFTYCWDLQQGDIITSIHEELNFNLASERFNKFGYNSQTLANLIKLGLDSLYNTGLKKSITARPPDSFVIINNNSCKC